MADATIYKAVVAWRTLANKVVQLTKATESTLATYRVYVTPSDRHDVGAGTVEAGFYFISYMGNPYLIIDTGTGYIDVEDSFRFRKCPTSGKNGIVYKSVGNGDSPYLAPFFRFLHPNAFQKFMGIALDILWRNSGGTDEKVKYNSSDAASGYLSEKVVAGNDIVLSEGTGGDADKLKISYAIVKTVQALSGTTVAWNVSNGVNGAITLSGNTTITLSNLVAGTSGNLSVTNPASLYTLTVSGYTNKISQTAYLAANQLKVSGSSKLDIFSWYFDGTYLWWNGGQDYK